MHSCHSFVFDLSSKASVNTPTKYHSYQRIGVRKDKRLYHANAVHLLKAQILRLKRFIRASDEESETLKEYTVSVLLGKERIEQDLSSLRAHYYEELGQAKQSRLKLQHAQAEVTSLKHRFVESERFILALLDLGLELPVLREAVSSVLQDDQPGEDTLMNAIQKADMDFYWPKGHSAVGDPSTAERYLSALELTISSRKELKEKAKVAQFWKLVAKSDSANADTVTPSASDLDQIQLLHHPTFNPSKASVIDDLVSRLRDTLLEKQMARANCGTRNFHDADPSPPYDSSSESAFPLSTFNHTTPSFPMTPILNRPSRRSLSVSNIPRRSPAMDQPFMLPKINAHFAREPEFHEGIFGHKNMQSLSGAARRLSDSNLPLKMALPNPSISKSTLSIETKFGLPLSPKVPFMDITSSGEHSFTRCHSKRMSYPFPTSFRIADDAASDTFQALLSLEKICAACSTSSLGSLQTSMEEEITEAGESWFAASSSTSSSAGEYARSDATLPIPQDSKANSMNQKVAQDRQDIAPLRDTITKFNADPNTMPPPVAVLSSKHAATGKTVKWALPPTPERNRSGSIGSTTSAATISSSASLNSGSSVSASSAEARPFAYGKPRPRSSSSPTHPTTAITCSKQTLLKFSRISKPKSAPASSPSTKLSQLPKTRPRPTLAGPGSTRPRRLPAGLKFQDSFNRPPRSPLRSQPSLGAPSREEGTGPSQQKGPQKKDNAKYLSNTQKSSPADGYDYTKPVMPLKVVKKGLMNPSLKKTPITLPLKMGVPALKPTNPSKVSQIRPGQSLIDGKASCSSEHTRTFLQDSSSPSTPLRASITLSDDIGHLSAFPNQPSLMKTSTAPKDARLSKLSPARVVPPIRSSSLILSTASQSPPRRPELGLSHPLRPRGMSKSETGPKPLSESKPPTSRPSTTPKFTPLKLKSGAGDLTSPSKSLRMDACSTSPLAKLRMSIMPPSSLVRSISRSKQRACAEE